MRPLSSSVMAVSPWNMDPRRNLFPQKTTKTHRQRTLVAVSRCVKGKLLADQQESRAFVNNSRDLSGMQKSRLNLLTILFQPDAFSRLSECCGAAKAVDREEFI